MESFYNGEYHLELYDKDKKSSLKQIETYIQSIKSRVRVQGKNGCYSSFIGNPFETIGNIITINKIKLEWTDVKPIAEATTEFILSSNQSCGEKRQAITLLTTLILTYPKMKELSEYISKTIEKRDEILKIISLDIFDTTNITTLTVALDCLGLLVGKISTVEAISSLSSISSMGDRDIIACMQYLSKSLEKADLKNLPLEIIASILQLSVSLFGNKERDIRYLSVKCYYKCVNAKKHTCDKKTVRKEWIENLAVQKALEILNDEVLVDYLVDRIFDLQTDENPRLPRLREQLIDVEKRIGNIIQAIEQGIIFDSTKERLAQLEKEKSELDTTILQEQIKKPFLTKDQIHFGIEKFKKLDISTKEGKQRLIDGFINAIYLYDDKITFTFNYKDGTKTVFLSELNSAPSGSDLKCFTAPP
ncbi:MAG: hypothetical protein J6C93_07835 [Clostridia bacterium]|nr:hypothetical protein [Clostridia bacterium]